MVLEEGARQVEIWFKKEGWETRLAFFDEYYVHIDLMVVPLAKRLTAVCLACTDPHVDLRDLEAMGAQLLSGIDSRRATCGIGNGRTRNEVGAVIFHSAIATISRTASEVGRRT